MQQVMKFRLLAALSVAVLAGLLWPSPAAAQSTSPDRGSNFVLSTIEGRVLGPDGKSVERAIVRLYEEGSLREAGRTITDPSGRYKFTITAGNYVVEVDPLNIPGLAKQRQDVLVNPAPRALNGERYTINFYLKSAVSERVVPRGPIFAQEVPPKAREEYERGVKMLGDNKEEGYAAIREAIQIFPEYYEALETLGTAYLKDGHIDPALVILMKAIEVNPKGERSHYALGVIYYQKGHPDLSILAFRRADDIVPNDPNTLMYLGLSLAREKQNAEAEKVLKRAYDLGAKKVPELHLALAQIYIRENRLKEAAAELRTLLKETPNLKDKDKIQQLIDKYEKGG